MNAKTKFTLIIWGVIAFFWWWIVLVMSLIPSNNSDIKNPRDLRFQSDTLWKAPTTWTNQWNNKWNSVKNQNNYQDNKSQIKAEKKEVHTLKILTYEKINSKTAWKIFDKKYNKATSWNIETVYYNNIDEYNKDLIYKLATKSDDFDLAVIPAEWFKNTEELSKLSFNLQNASFQISSLFDYNFKEFLEGNNIKAIPFALDPIVGYSISKKVKSIQTFDSWKRLIINNYKRLDKKWKLKYMPLFLWYDKNYIKYIEKNNKTLFPVFDYITKYYIFKKERNWLNLIKDFGDSITYKTFDFNLYIKTILKFKKDEVCKWNMKKYCLLYWKKTELVYWFSSDYNMLKNNWLKIYKKFKIKTKNTNWISLPVWVNWEYPARWWIIIINPNSKNLKYIWTFLKNYINIGKKWELPFYKNMISPFLQESKIKNIKFSFLWEYNWRFITLDKIWVWIKNNLDKKTINYLKWDISIDILLR